MLAAPTVCVCDASAHKIQRTAHRKYKAMVREPRPRSTMARRMEQQRIRHNSFRTSPTRLDIMHAEHAEHEQIWIALMVAKVNSSNTSRTTMKNSSRMVRSLPFIDFFFFSASPSSPPFVAHSHMPTSRTPKHPPANAVRIRLALSPFSRSLFSHLSRSFRASLSITKCK